MIKIARCTICIILLIFCMGCIENEQRAIVENIENNYSTDDAQINLVEDYYKELDKAGEMAYYINPMDSINYYNRPKICYVFDEEVFYMNESELEKIEYERAIITLNRQSIRFTNLNKIEEFGTSNYTNTHINAIVYSAFTPLFNLDDEQTNCIIFSRNILLKHCSTEAEKNTLSEYFKTIDTWSKFKDSLAYANVPMNNSDENRTFVIDNVEDMNQITGLNWKQADLEQYFEFLDSSGFSSSDEMLTFTRQFRTARQNINNESSDRDREKIYNAREFVITNFPQYNDDGIHKSDIQMYFYTCDNKS